MKKLPNQLQEKIKKVIRKEKKAIPDIRQYIYTSQKLNKLQLGKLIISSKEINIFNFILSHFDSFFKANNYQIFPFLTIEPTSLNKVQKVENDFIEEVVQKPEVIFTLLDIYESDKYFKDYFIDVFFPSFFLSFTIEKCHELCFNFFSNLLSSDCINNNDRKEIVFRLAGVFISSSNNFKIELINHFIHLRVKDSSDDPKDHVFLLIEAFYKVFERLSIYQIKVFKLVAKTKSDCTEIITKYILTPILKHLTYYPQFCEFKFIEKYESLLINTSYDANSDKMDIIFNTYNNFHSFSNEGNANDVDLNMTNIIYKTLISHSDLIGNHQTVNWFLSNTDIMIIEDIQSLLNSKVGNIDNRTPKQIEYNEMLLLNDLAVKIHNSAKDLTRKPEIEDGLNEDYKFFKKIYLSLRQNTMNSKQALLEYTNAMHEESGVIDISEKKKEIVNEIISNVLDQYIKELKLNIQIRQTNEKRMETASILNIENQATKKIYKSVAISIIKKENPFNIIYGNNNRNNSSNISIEEEIRKTFKKIDNSFAKNLHAIFIKANDKNANDELFKKYLLISNQPENFNKFCFDNNISLAYKSCYCENVFIINLFSIRKLFWAYLIELFSHFYFITNELYEYHKADNSKKRGLQNDFPSNLQYLSKCLKTIKKREDCTFYLVTCLSLFNIALKIPSKTAQEDPTIQIYNSFETKCAKKVWHTIFYLEKIVFQINQASKQKIVGLYYIFEKIKSISSSKA